MSPRHEARTRESALRRPCAHQSAQVAMLGPRCLQHQRTISSARTGDQFYESVPLQQQSGQALDSTRRLSHLQNTEPETPTALRKSDQKDAWRERSHQTKPWPAEALLNGPLMPNDKSPPASTQMVTTSRQSRRGSQQCKSRDPVVTPHANESPTLRAVEVNTAYSFTPAVTLANAAAVGTSVHAADSGPSLRHER